MDEYQQRIKGRSFLRFWVGFFPRLWQFIKYSYFRKKARSRNALIGENVIISNSLASKANRNLYIGNNSSIDSSDIDLRNQVHIGNNVIIGKKSKILTTSHNIDSEKWDRKDYGINIEDYVWIAENVIILPSCRYIGYGAVIGSGAVVVNNIPPLSVYSGNPAIKIRDRKAVHSELVVESLRGGDFLKYVQAYFKK